MPRFEIKQPSTPDRKGVNPFTREPMVIPGMPEKRRFWEIERRGASLEICEGDLGTRGRRKVEPLASELLAKRRMDRMIRARRNMGYADAGASIELTPVDVVATKAGSALLVDEYF